MSSIKGFLMLGLLTALGLAPVSAQQAPTPLDRTVLPIPEPTRPPITEQDARKATAPNVVIVLLDDIGFGHSSTFGGPIHMPTLQSLADNGLRYNRFHTTALCSPTRTALLGIVNLMAHHWISCYSS